MGEGVRKLAWAAKYAIELGADKQYVINLLEDINDYWTSSISSDIFQQRVLNWVDRWFLEISTKEVIK
jgi:hypothetical protein